MMATVGFILDTAGNRVWQSTLLGLGGRLTPLYLSYCNGKVFVMDTSVGSWFGMTYVAGPAVRAGYLCAARKPGVSIGGIATFNVLAGAFHRSPINGAKTASRFREPPASSLCHCRRQEHHVGLMFGAGHQPLWFCPEQQRSP